MDRWVSLGAGLIVESVAGSPYGFGVWEAALKAQLGYTQSEIETVGSVGNFGQYTGVCHLRLRRLVSRSSQFELIRVSYSIFCWPRIRRIWTSCYGDHWWDRLTSW